MEFENIDLDVHNRRYSAKHWTHKSKGTLCAPIKIMALHGWLDNSASFDFLVPFFDYQNLEIIALDSAGHGQSDHRRELNAYNIWSDVIELKWLLDELQWQHVFLLGHSRGAMIATLFSGAFPESVSGTALIEAFAPQALEESLLPLQLAQAANNLPKFSARKARRYKSFDDAVNARGSSFFELSFDKAQALAERAVMKDGDGYYWANDQKLLAPSEIKLSDTQVQAFINNMPSKALLVIGLQGLIVADTENYKKIQSQEKCNCVEFDGDHHLHMTAPPTILKKIAQTIQGYYVDQLKSI